MIFTAMAVLAFSAVSVANTIEVKEEVVVYNESREILFTSCEQQAIDYVAFCDPNNKWDAETAHGVYRNAVEECDRKEKSHSAN
ncbi:hypothetical protein [Flavobacterium succinicans]|uniref:Uncharacterized protein n=1 Tax=Flavobacterium succinicans TaxID=29536 RepID=A0A199XSY9_9FLAO|nr:hypothetical protein [Flavobacterium succinicans]OAZ04537.1 hypothetical protein FLB_10720 [Flavobacterium succinicans]